MAIPAPTAIAAPSTYFVAGTRKYVWVTTIANPAAPTSAEITAGTELSVAVQSVAGFDTPASEYAIPNAGNRFVGNIPGRITPSASSITFYQSLPGTTDVRSLFTQDLNGFICIFPEGISSTSKLDVFPVRVASVSEDQNIEQAGMTVVAFSITSTPQKNLATPTA